MNRKKRGLALLLCICMLFTLMPMAAFADGASAGVVYGSYTNGQWAQDTSMTADSSAKNYTNTTTGANVKYSKTAESKGNDLYDITLKIESETNPGASAVVLVIDKSYSMEKCATCNNGSDSSRPNGGYTHAEGCATGHTGSVSSDDSRFAKAIAAAKSFARSYAASGSNRYLAVVLFAGSATPLNFADNSDKGWLDEVEYKFWLDVSNAANLAIFNNKLSSSCASYTNLASGLSKAKDLFALPDVGSVDDDYKFTVALTDGANTAGGGWGVSADEAAKNAATSLKSATNSNNLYAVCYSAGQTVFTFLQNDITGAASRTFNADNTSALNTAFNTIVNNIKSGLSSGFTVTDPMGSMVTLQDTTLTDCTIVNDTITWEPTTGTTRVVDGKTIYTYTLTYTVKLNTEANGFQNETYYPTNGDTTLSFVDGTGNDKNKTLHFNVPGVKGVKPTYTVTYNKGANGTLAGQDSDGNVVHPNCEKNSTTPAAPAVTPADGYYFTGWDPTIASTVTADVTYTAQYAAKKTITIVANDNSKPYDGTALTPNGYSITIGSDKYESSTFTLNGKTYTVTGVTISGSQTDAGSSSATVNASTVSILVVNDDGTTTNVTDQFTVNTKNGKLTVAKKDVTITSADASKVYDGTPLTKHEATAVGFAGTDGATYTFTGSQTIPGNSYNTFTYTLNAGTNANNYNITTKNGTLTVTARTDKYVIEVEANSGSYTYDGTAKTASGFKTLEFTFNGQTYKVSGLSASISRTDAGTYTNAVTGTAVVKDAAENVVTDQFTVNTKNGKLNIAPIQLKLESQSATKGYDGTALTAPTVTVTGKYVTGEIISIRATGSITNPGSVTNTIAFGTGANYKAGNYSIEKSEGTLTVIATYTVTYQFVDENGTITELNGVTLVVPNDSNRYALNAEVTVLSNTNTVDGYTFDGWTATDADGNTVAINDGKLKMPASDVTITGTFSPVAGLGYTVEYYWIGDKGSEAPEKQIAPSKTVAGDEYCIFGDEIWPDTDAYIDIDGYTMVKTAEDYVVYFTTDPTKNVFRIYYYKNVDLTVADEETVYNGKAQEHSGAYTVTAQVDNEVLTGLVFDGVTASGSGTAANTYDVEFNGDPWGTVDTTEKYIVAGYSKGHLVINPRPLMITGASLGEKTYNGSAFTTDQYTWNTPTAEKPDVGLLEGDVIGNLAYLLTGTDAEDYIGKFSNPDNETFSIDNIIIFNAGGDKVQSNYAITIELGFLKINPITDEVVVEIKGHTDTKYYNGKIQEVNGYDVVDISNALYSASYVSLKELGSDHAEGKDVGTYYMGLDSGSFVNNNQNFVNVKFVVEDGWLKITNQPVDPGIYTKIIVKITGNSASEVYDGTEKSVEGYTVEISDPRYTEKDFKFTGTAEAKGTFVGEYPMGLEADQFVNINRRFKNVEFIIVEDGVLTITARPITITAGSAEGWVTDCPITCDEWTSTPPAPGDTVVSVKITGVQNGPGSSPNVPSDAVIKNEAGKDVTGNYDITYVNGLLVAKDLLEKEDHFNYVIGYPDGSVQPNGNITRAEVATIFYRLLTDEARAKYTTTDNSFSDIKAGEWYTKAIATLENANIIGGYPDGTFKPNAPITRAEMATIIAKFANLDENGKSFNDIKGHWAQSYVELAAGNGWINGYEDGTFRPDQNISRAETFAMINRVLDRQVESVDDLLPTSQMNMWSDNLDPTQWYYKDVQEATNYHKCDRVNESKYETWTEKVPDIDWAKIQY